MDAEYYKTKESVEEYIKMAKDVSGKILIEKLRLVLPANSTLLELGSGPGTDWNILNETYNVIGSDNSKVFLSYLKAKNPNWVFLEIDAVTLDTKKRFDGIYSNKVLHHLNDQELNNSVKRQAEILNTNGIICHSFWTGDGSEVFKGLFVNYHFESDLKNAFEKYFEVLSIEQYAEFDEGDSLLIIARKI